MFCVERLSSLGEIYFAPGGAWAVAFGPWPAGPLVGALDGLGLDPVTIVLCFQPLQLPSIQIP